MQALIVLAVTFLLLWVFFVRPQQRRVRAHQQLVAGLEEGDEVILTAGIHGRITELRADDMTLEVAPGVELRVARQAVLRQIETVPPPSAASPEVVTNGDSAGGDTPDGDQHTTGSDAAAPTEPT